ncbi:hypothetical protein C1645_834413 [Glomus cerebriforme]|uniref:Uncharacterized protein n=1 Tax=Glomus cerebriforme TaxID=658196 RepID=A0A397S9P9_9GLOM|nr:hypothetical protein C1645_834413 [Glomus cerebriforme]
MSSKYSKRQSINLVSGKRKFENNLVEGNNDDDYPTIEIDFELDTNLSFDHPHHNNVEVE